MSAFNEQPYAQRFQRMGDAAEGAFEAVYEAWGLRFQRFGWDRTDVSLRDVPAKLRYTPDYFTNKGLVECMGFGRDGTLKLKQDKLFALQDWHRDFRTDLFLWDSHNREWAFVRVPDLDITNPQKFDWVWGTFHDGKSYHAVRRDYIPVTDGGWRGHPDDGVWVPNKEHR